MSRLPSVRKIEKAALRSFFLVAMLVVTGCGPKAVKPPVATQPAFTAPPLRPAPPPGPSWRERVKRAVDTLGDRCYPGRQFNLDPESPGAVSAGSQGSSRRDSRSVADLPPRVVTAVSDLDYLADIEFARFRKKTSQLVLIGTPAESGNGIHSEDWLVVLRSINGPEAPGVSIDPGPNENLMQIRYFGGIEKTDLGDSFFEADRTLKLLSTGFDNYNCQLWRDRPTTIPTEMDLYSRELLSESSYMTREGWHRYWFEPRDEPLETEETPRAFTLKIPVNRLVVSDESIPPGHHSQSSSEFSEAVTSNFLDATTKIPAFRRLQSAAALVEIAKWMQDKEIPVDESWLGGTIAPFDTAETTPSITVLRAAIKDQVYLRFGIHGGVDFQKDNTYRTMPTAASDPIESAAAKTEPRTGSHWEFVFGGEKYCAVKLKIAHPKLLSDHRTRWVRMMVGLPQPMLYRLVFPESKLQVINHGTSPVAVSLRGPIEKSLSVSTASEFFNVLPGFYQLTASSGQCRQTTDSFTVDEGQSYRLEFSCVMSPARPGVPTGSYIVQNNTGASVEVAISGPSSATYQIPPGSQSIELEYGTYTVRVSATCGQKTETLSVNYGTRFTGTYTCETRTIYRPY